MTMYSSTELLSMSENDMLQRIAVILITLTEEIEFLKYKIKNREKEGSR